MVKGCGRQVACFMCTLLLGGEIWAFSKLSTEVPLNVGLVNRQRAESSFKTVPKENSCRFYSPGVTVRT